MNLTRIRLFLTKEKIYVITLSIFIAIGLSLGLTSILGATTEGDSEYPNKKVYQIFTDYYKGTEAGVVKQTMAMAFLGGAASVAVSLWSFVWMITKMREIKYKNDAFIRGGDIFLTTLACLIITGVSVAAIISQSHLNDASWWETQRANGFGGLQIFF